MKKTILLLSAVVVTIGITSGVVQALQTIDDDLQVNGNTTGIGNAFYTQNLRVNGSFSIGTNAPAQRFHLYSGSGTTMRFRIENGEGGCDFATDQNKFFMYVNNGVRMMIDEAGRVGIGTQSPTQRLHVAGTARVDVLEIAGGSDLAERFDVTGVNDEDPVPGMVVRIDPDRIGDLKVTTQANDRTVAGIISGAGGLNTGMLMGQQPLADGKYPVALTGRVYCYATAINGAIQPGDLLTTSDVPGHAMKVVDHGLAQGAIIGKAMTALEGGEGLVLVLVSLQ